MYFGFGYNDSGKNYFPSKDNDSISNEESNIGDNDNNSEPKNQNYIYNFQPNMNSQSFINYTFSNKNSFIGKKRKISLLSDNEDMQNQNKETKENSPITLPNKNESSSIDMIKKYSNNDIKINNKKTEKNIFRVIGDLPIEEILKKKEVPNNHVIDYYFQLFKTKFAHFYKNLLNKSKDKCGFKNKIENFSIPNSETFQENSNYSDNKKYLPTKCFSLKYDKFLITWSILFNK